MGEGDVARYLEVFPEDRLDAGLEDVAAELRLGLHLLLQRLRGQAVEDQVVLLGVARTVATLEMAHISIWTRVIFFKKYLGSPKIPEKGSFHREPGYLI